MNTKLTSVSSKDLEPLSMALVPNLRKPSIKRSPRNRNPRVTLHDVIKKDRNEAVRQNAVAKIRKMRLRPRKYGPTNLQRK